MSTLPTVALAGATGNLGPAMLKELLDAGFRVTVLTRSSSNSKIPPHANQIIKAVDYTSESSLAAALSGIDAVVSNLPIDSLEVQKPLIDASISAGVSRYLPSEFGSDLSNPLNSTLPVFAGKVAVRKYLEELVSKHENFSYTYVVHGPFLDWALKVGFLVDAKNHAATIYDGGDTLFSATRLATVGRGVVGILKNLEETKNKQVVFHEVVTSQNQIIKLINKIEGSQEWKTDAKATDDVEKWAYNELKKDDSDADKNTLGAMYGFITLSCVQGGRGNLTGKTWNDVLGVKEVKGEQEFEAVLRDILQK